VSKVLGAKVPNEMYEKIASLGPISTIVKQDVVEYLERRELIQNNEVNQLDLTVNRKENENGYRNTKRKVDQILSHLTEGLDERND